METCKKCGGPLEEASWGEKRARSRNFIIALGLGIGLFPIGLLFLAAWYFIDHQDDLTCASCLIKQQELEKKREQELEKQRKQAY